MGHLVGLPWYRAGILASNLLSDLQYFQGDCRRGRFDVLHGN